MEQHSIPQNILEVEFKLFGSFTLKQFGKMLIGSLLGLALFATPLIPPIVKFPLILAVVGVGFLSAIIENFGTWIWNFLRAVFISPRYVWIKERSSAGVLSKVPAKNGMPIQKEQDKVQEQPLDFDIKDIPLEKIFAARGSKDTNSQSDTNDQLDLESNLSINSAYKDVFNDNVKIEKPVEQNNLPEQPQTETVVENLNNASEIVESRQKLEELKYQLSKAISEGNHDLEEDIRSQINDAYALLKSLESTSNIQIPSTQQRQTLQGQNVIQSENHLFGIIVDKKDIPVENAEIHFREINSNLEFTANTDKSGKFLTGNKIPYGVYEVTVKHPQLKFHIYRVEVSDKQLPAFKFRER